MNLKGQSGMFGMVALFAICFMLVYSWLIISPVAVEPSIDTTIASINGTPNADGTEFFLRMIPWAVPIILIIGFLWWAVSGK